MPGGFFPRKIPASICLFPKVIRRGTFPARFSGMAFAARDFPSDFAGWHLAFTGFHRPFRRCHLPWGFPAGFSALPLGVCSVRVAARGRCRAAREGRYFCARSGAPFTRSAGRLSCSGGGGFPRGIEAEEDAAECADVWNNGNFITVAMHD